MKTSEIRRRFLEFFEKQDHRVVPAGSLVPGNDPTLLFTNAGMNQFKDVFLGTDRRDYSRATTAQRCVRAGGKHNDLENVGYTARHHTFFEMLGNFSFGDYFKRDAIRFAWTFLTEELGLPAEKLWVTVYLDDDEAADIWINEIGVDPNRLSRLDEDNFWMMGDTGPCGPCSEIFYDHGEDVPGGPPGSPDDDLDRYIEIWNLVFMQFDTQEDGTRLPLPKPSVDTGMGLERLAAILQGVHSNYEIDLFQALIRAAMTITGCTDIENRSLRVVADHIRSTAFLIADGVIPSNEGRGYVLRRIIRRAVRHGYKLGCQELFLYKLVDDLVEQMGAAYPELAEQAEHVKKVLKIEEEQFARTLENGMAILEQGIADLSSTTTIPGELVFKLYDTYGFPADLTADVAREKGMDIDQAGFEACMAEQRARAKSANKFKMDRNLDLNMPGETTFLGYDSLTASGTILRLLKDSQPVESLTTGESGTVILDQTPFYAESGGQSGDQGEIRSDQAVLDVSDCQKLQGHFLHQVTVESGSVTVGDSVNSQVKRDERENTARHHSATHLLHAALREVLGTHVQQRGSLVTYDKLRFDFSHLEAVTQAELDRIESIVNQQIQANADVTTELMDIDSARESGAVALFGEKYDDEVRVLTMGQDGYSKELCGGTHVNRTGDIGLFRIHSEGGIAAGVRRIEAVAGPYALAEIRQQDTVLHGLCAQFKCSADQLDGKVQQLVSHSRDLEKEISRLKDKLASAAAGDLSDKAVDVQGVKVLALRLDGVDAKSLRSTMDQMKNKLGSAIIFLAAVNDDKIQLAAGVTKDLTAKAKAGNLIKEVGELMGAKGGGKPDMAMAGGGDLNKIQSALDAVPGWVEQQLTN